MAGERWWHAYGGVVDGIWFSVMAGDTDKPPGEWLAEPLRQTVFGRDVALPHVGSWDHEPTQQEVDDVTPERFRGD